MSTIQWQPATTLEQVQDLQRMHAAEARRLLARDLLLSALRSVRLADGEPDPSACADWAFRMADAFQRREMAYADMVAEMVDPPNPAPDPPLCEIKPMFQASAAPIERFDYVPLQPTKTDLLGWTVRDGKLYAHLRGGFVYESSFSLATIRSVGVPTAVPVVDPAR